MFPQYKKDGFGWNYPDNRPQCSVLTAVKLRKKLPNVEFYPSEEVDEAELESFTDMPDSEMERIEFYDELPDTSTYPTIHTELLRKAMEYSFPQGD